MDVFDIKLQRPKFHFNAKLRDEHGFVGIVDSIFRNFQSAVDCNLISSDWWDIQEIKPSTKNQIFYSIINESGAVLVGENDAVEEIVSCPS